MRHQSVSDRAVDVATVRAERHGVSVDRGAAVIAIALILGATTLACAVGDEVPLCSPSEIETPAQRSLAAGATPTSHSASGALECLVTCLGTDRVAAGHDARVAAVEPPEEPGIAAAETRVDAGPRSLVRAGFDPAAEADERGLDTARWFHAPDEQSVVPPHILRLLEDTALAEQVLAAGTIHEPENLDPEHVVLRARMQLQPEHAALLGVDSIRVCVKPDADQRYGDEFRRELVFYILAKHLGLEGLVPIVERDIALAPMEAELREAVPSRLHRQLLVEEVEGLGPALHGSVQIWVEGFDLIVGEVSTDPTRALFDLADGLRDQASADADPIWQTLSDMFVLDFLIYNSDRNGELGTVRLPDGGQRLVLLDNGDALMMRDPDRNSRDCRRLFERVRRFSPNVHEGLATLDRDTIERLLVDTAGRPLSSDYHLDHLEERVQEARRFIDDLADDRGGLETVLFPTRSRLMSEPSTWGGYLTPTELAGLQIDRGRDAAPAASVALALAGTAPELPGVATDPPAEAPPTPAAEQTQPPEEPPHTNEPSPTPAPEPRVDPTPRLASGFGANADQLWEAEPPPTIAIDLGIDSRSLDDVFDHLDSVWPDRPRDCPWEELAPGEGDGLYARGTVTFTSAVGEQATYRDVGVRYRGHGADSSVRRLSIELRFDAFVPGARAFGTVEALELYGEDAEIQWLPDRSIQCVGHALLEAFGAPAARCNFVETTVDGHRLPIMQNVEMPDNMGFVAAHVGADDAFSAAGGNYFRCDGDCIGRCHFEYGGADPDDYERFMPIAPTVPADVLHAVVPLFECGRGDSDGAFRECVESLLDVDATLRVLVAEGAMASRDGFGTDGDNVVLYHDPTKGLVPVLHDLDEAMWSSMAPLDVDGAFTDRLLDVYRPEWCALMRELLEGPMSRDGFAGIMDRLFTDRVRASMEGDRTHPDWGDDIDRWPEIVASRAEAIRRALPGLCPERAETVPSNGMFDQRRVRAPDGFEPHTTAAADFDGDGRVDLVAHDGERSIVLMRGTGGSFEPTQVLVLSGARELVSLAAADLDGDGDVDVVAADEVSDVLLVANNDGTGALTQTDDRLATGAFPNFVIASDLDRDGDPDLVTADKHGSTLTVFQNLGRGRFADPVRIPLPCAPVHVSVARMSSESRLDIVASCPDADGVFVVPNLGDGAWDPPQLIEPVGSAIWTEAVDLDGDGDDDLVSLRERGRELALFTHEGSGSLVRAAVAQLSRSAVSFAVADLDRDGIPDLAVAHESSDAVTVHLGGADRSWEVSARYEVGDDPRFVVACDVDQDGWTDLVGANHTSFDFSVLRSRLGPPEQAADAPLARLWRP